MPTTRSSRPIRTRPRRPRWPWPERRLVTLSLPVRPRGFGRQGEHSRESAPARSIDCAGAIRCPVTSIGRDATVLRAGRVGTGTFGLAVPGFPGPEVSFCMTQATKACHAPSSGRSRAGSGRATATCRGGGHRPWRGRCPRCGRARRTLRGRRCPSREAASEGARSA